MQCERGGPYPNLSRLRPSLGSHVISLTCSPSESWRRRPSVKNAPAPELSAEDIVKQTQTVVRAYSCLVAESGTNLPESALPYPKEVIRTSLLLWAALEDEPETRTRLCALYVMLEDFLPHDEWKILHEWHHILNTKDMDSLLKADPRFRETAVRLMNETAELGARRMHEFKERLGEVETRPIGLILDAGRR